MASSIPPSGGMMVRFWGAFECSPPLSPAHVQDLEKAIGDGAAMASLAGGVAPPGGEFCWEIAPEALVAPDTVVTSAWDHVAWLHYLQAFVFYPWGHQLRGRVEWTGKNDPDEFGHIVMIDGPPIVSRGARVYTELAPSEVLPKEWTTCITPISRVPRPASDPDGQRPPPVSIAGLWTCTSDPKRPWHFEVDRATGRPDVELGVREADATIGGWYSTALGEYRPTDAR
jgi:hypothetical protein